jgi:phospholipid:diacylglycerol acyltransferase
MSGIRRRVGRLFADTPDSSRDASPAPGEEVKLVPVKSLESLKKKTKTKRKNGFMFGLGGLFGIIIALYFAQQQDVLNFESMFEMNMDTILDVIPAGIIKDARELTKSEREVTNYDSFAVGMHVRSQGIRAQHPVIMIPGVISTGLESWATDDDSRQYFRKRLWGSWTRQESNCERRRVSMRLTSS